MIPIVTPEQMRAIDLASPLGLKRLVDLAGRAVAMTAINMMGGTYGRRVVVIIGKGNNGADGRVAANVLRCRGVVVDCLGPGEIVPSHRRIDLIIDAAFGTGLRDSFVAPAIPAGVAVLAVDIPSGVDGLTGLVNGSPLRADRTVTFGAYKPGLLFGDGPQLAGHVTVADLGLDCGSARAHMVEQRDVARWVPSRADGAHKWKAATLVVAGSPGMFGAGRLASAAAQRAGAGMVRLGSPGCEADPFAPTEVVSRPMAGDGWAIDVLADLKRFHSVVIGPGLGRLNSAVTGVRQIVSNCRIPIVVDADGLLALSVGDGGAAEILRSRVYPTVLTPHDAEFALLFGERPGADRLQSTRFLAARTGAVVLLKGPSTIVASPDGRHLVVTEGSPRLATAGTGAVLAGVVGAMLAQGIPAFEAAAAAAFVHGRASQLGHDGLIASDLIDLLPGALQSIRSS